MSAHAPTSSNQVDRLSVIRDRDLPVPVIQAFWLLRLGFTVAPILFGLDKFTNVLVDWETYVAPVFTDTLGISGGALMSVVGVVEVVAGILVFARPRIGGWVVAGWLGGIILDLLVLGDHYDVALRDFGLLLGALTLARLAAAVPRDANPLPSATARG
ncbi:hypothetical protein [Euzebya rosea]|uniref:hypothetical protein n=1 Tax=Euzebya rosea TaxID=2052804 RepID=UPI000D3E9349|nr:hypothetical protein [Euzebya rosea]